MRTNVFAQLSFLRCFSFLCWQRGLVGGLGTVSSFSLQVCLLLSGLICSVFALLCFRLCLLCCGVVHVSFPFFFCDCMLDVRDGHLSSVVLSALCCLRLGFLRLPALVFLETVFSDVL